MTPAAMFRARTAVSRLGRAGARSHRVRFALLTGAASSLGGLILSIALAHRLAPEQFSQFAVAMAVGAFVVGVQHAALAEPLLGHNFSANAWISSNRRVSLLAAALGLAVGVSAYLTGSPYLWATAFATHGLSLYDLNKTVSLARGRASRALLLEVLLLCATATFATLLLTGRISGLAAYVGYAIATALIGYSSCLLARAVPIPAWPQEGPRASTSAAFAGEYISGSGLSQLLLPALAGIGRTDTVAAFRAGGTLLGPVTFVLTASRLLLIPHLSPRRDGSEHARDRVRRAQTAGLLMSLLAVPPLALLAFTPSSVGLFLLGQNWPLAQQVLPLLALELWLSVAATVPTAGHRAELAGKRAFMVRSVLGGFRLVAVMGAAYLFGSVAAAAAMVLSSLIAAIAWWLSYFHVRTVSADTLKEA